MSDTNKSYREFLLEGERVGMRYSLAVPRTSAAALAGLQLGQRAGSSLEFKDHRDYQPGDDLRRIDWNAFARSDKLIVKLFREEISPHLDIIIDGSRSMAIEQSAKAEAAVGMAAVLAVAAENAGYSHSAWLAREWCAPVAGSGNRPSAWGEISFDHRGHPAESLARVPPKLRRQGLRVFLSDLLWLGEPLQLLQQLNAGGAQGAAAVVVVQLLGDADANPPERGRLRLIDSETDQQQEIFIDDGAINRYRNALARHQQNWHRACRQAGATMVELIAEQVIAGWNLEAMVKAAVLKV
jgi:uncharacterized protein (DUF58 family)